MLPKKEPWVKGVAHWTADSTAYISAAFTWRLPEAVQIAARYRSEGFQIRVGGPGTFTQKKYLLSAGLYEDEIGGSVPDAIAHHNPMARCTKAHGYWPK